MILQPRWGCIIQDVRLPIERVFVVDVPAVLVPQGVHDAFEGSGFVRRDFQPRVCLFYLRLRQIVCVSFCPLSDMSSVGVWRLRKN